MSGVPDIALAPINKTASKVIGAGTHFEPIMKKGTVDVRDTCPPVWKGTHITRFSLRGLKFGWFTVIGLSEEKPKRWVVRCVCGKYEFRTAKALRNSKTEMKCLICRKTEYISYKKNKEANP